MDLEKQIDEARGLAKYKGVIETLAEIITAHVAAERRYERELNGVGHALQVSMKEADSLRMKLREVEEENAKEQIVLAPHEFDLVAQLSMQAETQVFDFLVKKFGKPTDPEVRDEVRTEIYGIIRNAFDRGLGYAKDTDKKLAEAYEEISGLRRRAHRERVDALKLAIRTIKGHSPYSEIHIQALERLIKLHQGEKEEIDEGTQSAGTDALVH